MVTTATSSLPAKDSSLEPHELGGVPTPPSYNSTSIPHHRRLAPRKAARQSSPTRQPPPPLPLFIPPPGNAYYSRILVSILPTRTSRYGTKN